MVAKEDNKVTEVLINKYELVLIVSPEVPDDGLEPVIESVTQYITSKGGQVEEVNKWGRRKLAYPIKHMMEGNYILFKFSLQPSDIRELENNLKISEKIIRHLVVRMEE
jgi:small subunit ribosomal protein S6